MEEETAGKWRNFGNEETNAASKSISYNPRYGKWVVEKMEKGKFLCLGRFDSFKTAALVHDIDVLRKRKLKDDKEPLIESYDVREEVQSSHGHYQCRDQNGIIFTVYSGSQCIETDKEFSQTESMNTKLDTSLAMPVMRIDYKRRFVERAASLFTPSATFAYDVTFPFQHALGLNLTPHFLQYSSQGGKRVLGCCIVVEALNAALSSLVLPGDILLKINDTCLLGSPADGFNFDNVTKLIQSAAVPRVIRFMRPAGSSVNLLPSPVEAQLLAEGSPLARFIMANSGQGFMVQQQYLDQNAPLAVKKMMQGQKVSWEVVGPSPLVGGAPVGAPTPSPAVPAPTHTHTHTPYSSREVPSTGMRALNDVFRDHNKWVVCVRVPKRGHISHVPEAGAGVDEGGEGGADRRGDRRGATHFVGRFDTEDAANAAHHKAMLEVQRTGRFVGRRGPDPRMGLGTGLHAPHTLGVAAHFPSSGSGGVSSSAGTSHVDSSAQMRSFPPL